MEQIATGAELAAYGMRRINILGIITLSAIIIAEHRRNCISLPAPPARAVSRALRFVKPNRILEIAVPTRQGDGGEEQSLSRFHKIHVKRNSLIIMY